MNRMVGFLVVLVLVAAACSDDQPTAGPITIETQIPMTEECPPGGTFEVTEGESGEREGTFNVVLTPEPGPGITQISAWTLAQATGGFTGLQGTGDMVMEPAATEATETFTGDIEYGS